MKAINPDLKINLANETEYFLFQSDPGELEKLIAATKPKTVFINEIQRIPRLTNTIQSIIDDHSKIKFYLTGSSARKLRKGQANLLPGRLISYAMHPLSVQEIGDDWQEDKALQFGTLPGIYKNENETEVKNLLRTYASTYLKEEIMAESLVRQIDGFIRFLNAAAFSSGEFLDYSKLSKKAKIPRQSVARHFEILEDTLVVRKVENDPHLDLDFVDLVKHPRFYFFDLGVLNALRGSFSLNQERIGYLFEHLVFNQIINSSTILQNQLNIYNFRTRGGLEVDFIVEIDGKKTAIECKSSQAVSSSELNALKKIDTYYPKIKKIVIYRGLRELKDGDVWILPLPKAREVLGL